jgi:hypothetical protein
MPQPQQQLPACVLVVVVMGVITTFCMLVPHPLHRTPIV